MVASFCQGLSGSVTSVITGVTAYLTTVTEPHARTNRLLFLFAFSSIAGMLGPLTAGALNSPLASFVLMLVLHLVNIAYIAARLENITGSEDGGGREGEEKRFILSLGHLKDSFYTCFGNRTMRQRVRIGTLFVMAFIVMVITSGKIHLT